MISSPFLIKDIYSDAIATAYRKGNFCTYRCNSSSIPATRLKVGRHLFEITPIRNDRSGKRYAEYKGLSGGAFTSLFHLIFGCFMSEDKTSTSITTIQKHKNNLDTIFPWFLT